jgi:hypothetical protein
MLSGSRVSSKIKESIKTSGKFKSGDKKHLLNREDMTS